MTLSKRCYPRFGGLTSIVESVASLPFCGRCTRVCGRFLFYAGSRRPRYYVTVRRCRREESQWAATHVTGSPSQRRVQRGSMVIWIFFLKVLLEMYSVTVLFQGVKIKGGAHSEDFVLGFVMLSRLMYRRS